MNVVMEVFAGFSSVDRRTIIGKAQLTLKRKFGNRVRNMGQILRNGPVEFRVQLRVPYRPQARHLDNSANAHTIEIDLLRQDLQAALPVAWAR